MTILFVLGLLLAQSIGALQQIAPDQQVSQVPHHNLTGTVTNAITGEPINHALVQCISPRSTAALTGPDGRFEFPNMPEGQIAFSVNKPGFFDPNWRPGRAQVQPFRLTAANTSLSLKLLPAARIAGRLTDEDGEGIEQTTVLVLAESISNGHKAWETRSATTTDDDGFYSVDDLYPGRYSVFAGGHVIPDSNWDGHLHVFAPAYYPGGPDISSAQQFDLQAGQEYRADFHLRPERAIRVSGTFAGVPAALGLAFWFTNASGQSVQWPLEIDSRHGQWKTTALPPGTWNLTMAANDNEGHSWRATQQIAVGDSEIANLQIMLHPAVSIPITINHAAEQSVNQFIDVNLASLDPLNPRRYGVNARRETPGLSFDNVDPGKYRLGVSPRLSSSECLDSAWYGNIDLLRNDLIVADGSGVQPITINLRNDCATLSPKMEGGGMAVVNAGGLNLPPAVLASGQKVTLSPGTYRVYAFTDVNDLEYANPEVMRDFPGQEVELTPNQNLELTLKPIERKEN